MIAKRTLILRMRKRQLKFLGHKMRKESLENLTLTGNIEDKRDKGKTSHLILVSVNGWMNRGQEVWQREILLMAMKEVVESYNHPHPRATWHIE